MKVKKLQEVAGTELEVTAANGTWTSRRIVVADDQVGFSLHETFVKGGSVNKFHYAHHAEAVLIVEGTGSVTELSTGVVHHIGPGSMYLLDQHDEHILTADSELRAICVFTPAVVGPERHDASGAYPVTLQTEPPG